MQPSDFLTILGLGLAIWSFILRKERNFILLFFSKAEIIIFSVTLLFIQFLISFDWLKENWFSGLSVFIVDKDISASILKHKDYDAKIFPEKILIYQPKYICFNCNVATLKYLIINDTKLMDAGLNTALINKTKIFIAPSTSPKAFAYCDESTWKKLKTLIN